MVEGEVIDTLDGVRTDLAGSRAVPFFGAQGSDAMIFESRFARDAARFCPLIFAIRLPYAYRADR